MFLPNFERREFMLAARPGPPSRVNARMDTIVRKPLGKERDFIPVGVVPRDYARVNHVDVVKMAERPLEEGRSFMFSGRSVLLSRIRTILNLHQNAVSPLRADANVYLVLAIVKVEVVTNVPYYPPQF